MSPQIWNNSVFYTQLILLLKTKKKTKNIPYLESLIKLVLMKDFRLNIYDDGLKSSYDDISAVELLLPLQQ